MLAILNSLNAHNFHIFQWILMILVSKFMIHKDLSDKTYLSLGLLSPLICFYCILFLSAQTDISAFLLLSEFSLLSAF